VSGYFSGGLLLGGFTVLLGIGLIAGALGRRRGRARYPETYAESGGVAYTIVQIGCGVLALIGGAFLITMAVILRR
jgi:hypothetical protein